MKVLFLYTELADYFLKCCEALSAHAEVHIIRWPVNKEAPFEFKFAPQLRVYDKTALSREQLHNLVQEINPSVVICSGWIDRDYLSVVKKYRGSIPTIMVLDTHWRASAKQLIALLPLRRFLKKRFSHAWVPGAPQAHYATKLGFKREHIRKGFYCCDLERFNGFFNTQIENKKRSFPKKFIYAGRYYTFKGVDILWEAFSGLTEEERNGWELWCMGTGSLEPVFHPGIKHLGFVQPTDLAPVLAETGIFILPSRFEPWAVVVQEFGAAGFPMLLSTAVGAASSFLEPGMNGFLFKPGDAGELRVLLKKVTSLSAKELLLMAEKSHELAQKINHLQWTQTILDIHNGWHKK